MRSVTAGTIRRISLACLIVGNLRCGLVTDARPLEYPRLADVTELVVSQASGDITSTITDPAKIERIMAFLVAHNTGFRKPLDTFPGPQYTVMVRDRSGDSTVVWIGENWLGGREVGGANTEKRLRSLEPDERVQLLSLLEVRGAPPNNALQLTKPAQAMELRS